MASISGKSSSTSLRTTQTNTASSSSSLTEDSKTKQTSSKGKHVEHRSNTPYTARSAKGKIILRSALTSSETGTKLKVRKLEEKVKKLEEKEKSSANSPEKQQKLHNKIVTLQATIERKIEPFTKGKHLDEHIKAIEQKLLSNTPNLQKLKNIPKDVMGTINDLEKSITKHIKAALTYSHSMDILADKKTTPSRTKDLQYEQKEHNKHIDKAIEKRNQVLALINRYSSEEPVYVNQEIISQSLLSNDDVINHSDGVFGEVGHLKTRQQQGPESSSPELLYIQPKFIKQESPKASQSTDSSSSTQQGAGQETTTVYSDVKFKSPATKQKNSSSHPKTKKTVKKTKEKTNPSPTKKEAQDKGNVQYSELQFNPRSQTRAQVHSTSQGEESVTEYAELKHTTK